MFNRNDKKEFKKIEIILIMGAVAEIITATVAVLTFMR